MNASFDFRIPRGEGPLGREPLADGFGAVIQFSYGSGYPYTASGQGTAEPPISTAGAFPGPKPNASR